MRIIFDGEKQKRIFLNNILADSCSKRLGFARDCKKQTSCADCWEAAVKCEIAEPKAMIELEVIPITCNDCPCFGHESGRCQVTGQEYDENGRLDECPIKQ